MNISGWQRKERQDGALHGRKAHSMNSTAGSHLSSESLFAPEQQLSYPAKNWGSGKGIEEGTGGKGEGTAEAFKVVEERERIVKCNTQTHRKSSFISFAVRRANCLRWAAANADAIEYVQKHDDLDPVISSTATDWRVCKALLTL